MRTLTLLGIVAAGVLAGCKKSPPEATPVPAAPASSAPSKPPSLDDIQAVERRASERDAQRECRVVAVVYDGVVKVDTNEWVHGVERNGHYVVEPIPDLDRVIAKGSSFSFTLEYPFDRPFTGSVEGDLTARKALSAIRAGFRTMYDGAKVRDIEGLMNKQVTGVYGEAIHDIGDLVIEGVELCEGNTLQIAIGS